MTNYSTLCHCLTFTAYSLLLHYSLTVSIQLARLTPLTCTAFTTTPHQNPTKLSVYVLRTARTVTSLQRTAFVSQLFCRPRTFCSLQHKKLHFVFLRDASDLFLRKFQYLIYLDVYVHFFCAFVVLVFYFRFKLVYLLKTHTFNVSFLFLRPPPEEISFIRQLDQWLPVTFFTTSFINNGDPFEFCMSILLKKRII